MGRDIIFRYDEANAKIICKTVEHDLLDALFAKALPLETSIDSLKAKGADEAERIMGSLVLALLDSYSDAKMGIRDYAAKAVEWEAQYTEELERKSASGDPAAQYELATHRISEGLTAKSIEKMNEAESLLRQAVASGHAEAADYWANHWPALKELAVRKFK